MAGRYQVEVSFEASEELRNISAFQRPPILKALRALQHDAATRTRNRKPLEEPLHALPEATWEIRVDQHRVLYNIEGGLVSVLRVILKATTTEEGL
jgi:mRNA-degrading endonuclease RelE of RelBE toxin-antitoxin system